MCWQEVVTVVRWSGGTSGRAPAPPQSPLPLLTLNQSTAWYGHPARPALRWAAYCPGYLWLVVTCGGGYVTMLVVVYYDDITV